MADFCKQCSIDMWGADTKDLADSEHESAAVGTIRLHTICEGCGFTVVDPVTGECIGDCLLHHGRLKVQTSQQFLEGKLPAR